MTDMPQPRRQTAFQRLFERAEQRLADWRNDKIASPDFQAWAGRFPLTRRASRKAAHEVYDLVSGFVYSQTLLACVELDILRTAQTEALDVEDAARDSGIDADRMRSLCQAAASLDLLTRQRDGRYRLGRVGAAVLGVPGLELMIRHHRIFYRDLADPVGLLSRNVQTELSQYWPYVRGEKTHDVAPDVAQTYSELMATSQALVAEQTLRAVSLAKVARLLDVGGGTGAFLCAVAAVYPEMDLDLFDLPPVVATAKDRCRMIAPEARIAVHGGSFLDDPLPAGADAISLVRVLYDHDDDTAAMLLKKVHAALPAGGMLVISEPMSGGEKPNRAGDAYFGFYTMAMTSGRPRSAARHRALLEAAGFVAIEDRPTETPFITSVLTARKRGLEVF